MGVLCFSKTSVATTRNYNGQEEKKKLLKRVYKTYKTKHIKYFERKSIGCAYLGLLCMLDFVGNKSLQDKLIK